MISSFPKIFQMADRHVQSIWDGDIEVTEKIDGSQFVFGVVEGKLYMRSKGSMIFSGDHYVRDITGSDLFFLACSHVSNLYQAGLIPDGHIYYGETLQRPKHNTLTYERCPTNHIALFGFTLNGVPQEYSAIQFEASRLGVDAVPLLHQGPVPKGDRAKWVLSFLDRVSYLGKSHIEGVVIKAYKEYFVGGELVPIMSAKYVSEAFKEVHRATWTRDKTSGGKWDVFKDGYRTDARWMKAIQYVRDSGELEMEPRDIGKLIKRINQDIMEEEQEAIKSFLWAHFSKELMRNAARGFPEFYKKWLLEEATRED